MQCLLKRCRQKERKKLSNITICIDDERQAKIDCILNSDSEYRTAEELVQFLFDEALQAHYLLYGKCANEYEEGFFPMKEVTPQVVE